MKNRNKRNTIFIYISIKYFFILKQIFCMTKLLFKIINCYSIATARHLKYYSVKSGYFFAKI